MQNPPLLRSFNRFLPLLNLINNLFYFSLSNSFSSAAKRRPNLKSNNLTSDISSKKPLPHDLSQVCSSVSKTFSSHTLQSSPNNCHTFSTTSLNFRAHYDSLTYPNGRFLSQSNNGVALASRLSSPDLSPVSLAPPSHSSLFNDLYSLVCTIFLLS